MRCRVGDLAVIVRSKYAGNIGCLVTVVVPSDLPERDWLVRSEGRKLLGKRIADDRVTESPMQHMRDSSLRPIRPDADPVTTDETLTVNA